MISSNLAEAEAMLHRLADSLIPALDHALMAALSAQEQHFRGITPVGEPDPRHGHMADDYYVDHQGPGRFEFGNASPHAEDVFFGSDPHDIPNAFGWGESFGIGGRFAGRFHPGTQPNQALGNAADDLESVIQGALDVSVADLIARTF